MSDTRGLYARYDVKRVDGKDAPGGKHAGCTLFVLDLRHDPDARHAALAYAEACETKRPNLASDLRELVRLEEPTDD